MSATSRPEEDYFLAAEARLRQELLEKAERSAAAEQHKREIAGSLGTHDEALIERIHALGLEGEIAGVLHLLPLVQVAWADGNVSASERKTIMGAVEARGIKPGSPSATFMASLLETKPSDTLLNEILSVLKDLLAAKGLKPESVLDACSDVAQASGGLLGFGDKMSQEEREALDRIGASLNAGSRKL
jgi:tellurite resistance protein